MYRRVIQCQITNEYVKGAGVPVGAAGSHHDVALELSFSPMWAGSARTITWYDALMQNPTLTLLTVDLLKEGETEVYIVPIPAEPKAEPGEMTMTIKGVFVEDGVETSATLSTSCKFTVLPSDYDEDAAEEQDVTPTLAEQLQAEVEEIKDTIWDARAAATEAAASASAAAVSAQGASGSQQAAAASQVAAANSEANALASKNAAASSAAQAAESARNAQGSAAQAANRVAEHNNSTSSHADIRQMIEDVANELNEDGVKFKRDLITTCEIGNIVPENGHAVIPAAGKSLSEVWNSIFVLERNPDIEYPVVTIVSPECKSYEMGEKVTPTYAASFDPGHYEYGPGTGVAVTAWEVTNTDGDVLTTPAGTFPEIIVGEGMNYSITAKATYGAGAMPLTNLGNAYTEGQIAAGTVEAVTSRITMHRKGFYGTADSKAAVINSAFVRSLEHRTNNWPAEGDVWVLPIPVGTERIVFAYPQFLRDVSSVLDVNGMNAEIKTAFTQSRMPVECANGYAAYAYKVYVMDRATPTTEANTFKITI